MSRLFLYVCAFVATAVLVTSAHAQTVHDVDQVFTEFQPATIMVEPGDTIRWHRSSGTHTVTSGDGCTFDGRFDMPLDAENLVAEWTVPADAPAVVPYYCRPHCAAFGMEGVIMVAGGCEGDIDGDGLVAFGDLLQILSNWGPCDADCSMDIDNNNSVDFADLLLLLSNWGPCGGSKG